MIIKKGTKLNINEDDFRLCVESIRKRSERDFDNKDYKSFKVCNSDYEDINIPGLLAEVGLSRLLGCDINNNLSILKNPKQESGYDIEVSGIKIDVKWTKYKSGRLLVPLRMDYKINSIDYFALVTGDKNEMVFKGVASVNDVIKQENIGNVGYGENYILTQGKLKDLTIGENNDWQRYKQG